MNFDRHFYLLAKNWYSRDTIKRDIATIQAKYCGLNFECCTVNELFHAGIHRMLGLVYTHIKDRDKFSNFVVGINRHHESFFTHGKHNDFDVALAQSCLSFLSITSVEEIPFKLGFPDYEVLPYKIRLWRTEKVCFGI